MDRRMKNEFIRDERYDGYNGKGIGNAILSVMKRRKEKKRKEEESETQTIYNMFQRKSDGEDIYLDI
ncbi:hypothetical protein EYC84_005653 [Monilinia fructicola]|uniref:Uncharacterized protein n=1 Tax=Monilinia fructicola TaxID=38448 RepID=A0A5M9JX48_MONFR|nr:hypothetical protein EYC84_005653 [Monilinia fructicola]